MPVPYLARRSDSSRINAIDDPKLQAIFKKHPTLQPLLQSLYTTAFLSNPNPASRTFDDRDDHGSQHAAPRHGRASALARIKRSRLVEQESDPSGRRYDATNASRRGGRRGQGHMGHGQGHRQREDPAMLRALRDHEQAEDEGLREFRIWALAQIESSEETKA